MSGLNLIVQPTGAKVFRLWTRVNGKQVPVTIGDATLMTLADARAKAKAVLGRTANGEDPREARDARKAAQSIDDRVEQVVDSYIAKYLAKKCKPSWAKEAERLLRVEVVPKFGKKRLGEIEDADVYALLVEIAERGAPRTSNLVFAVLRKLCNWATTLEGGRLIRISPCAGVKALSGNNKRERVLEDDEVRSVWRAAGKVGWPFGPIYRIALLTGVRRDEVAGMEWPELNLEAKTWMIPGKRTKNKKLLVLPLSDAAAEIIRALPRMGDFKVRVHHDWNDACHRLQQRQGRDRQGHAREFSARKPAIPTRSRLRRNGNSTIFAARSSPTCRSWGFASKLRKRSSTTSRGPAGRTPPAIITCIAGRPRRGPRSSSGRAISRRSSRPSRPSRTLSIWARPAGDRPIGRN